MSEIADGRTRGAIGRVLDLIGETRRLRPTGIAKWIVAAFSCAAVFLITYLALFGVASAGFWTYFGGSFNHPPVTFDYFLEMQVIGIAGVFGSPLSVAASYAFLFVLFGNFYVISGGGQLFFDVAAAVTGRYVGGPAKWCGLSSGPYRPVSGRPGSARAL